MLKNYIKIAFKVFMRRKFFTLISLFGISVTLTVLMVATTFIDHVVGVRAPEVNLDRSLMVVDCDLKRPEAGRSGSVSYVFLDRYVRNLPSVEHTSFYWGVFNTKDMYWNGEKISLFFKRTDAAYWQILAFDFLEGRPITQEDEDNARFVTVINASTRKKLFGERSALGEMIEIDKQRFRVIGVVADVPFYRIVPFADMWVPLTTIESDRYLTEWVHGFQALILANKISDIPKIKEAFLAGLSHVDLPPDNGKNWETIEASAETYVEMVSRELLVGLFDMGEKRYDDWSAEIMGGLLGIMVLFMVLPTLNLVNLNMSRILERTSEIGVRKAFGASSWRLVGQFVVENVLLALVGGAIGFVLSFAVLEVIAQSGVIPYAKFDLNLRVFFYGLLIAVFFGVFSGTYPAWKMSRMHPVEALRRRVK